MGVFAEHNLVIIIKLRLHRVGHVVVIVHWDIGLEESLVDAQPPFHCIAIRTAQLCRDIGQVQDFVPIHEFRRNQ